MRKILNSLIFLTVFALALAEQHHHHHPHSQHHHHHGKARSTDHGIKAWIQGSNKEHAGPPTKIYFKADSTSEIVLRDLKDIAVHCEAEFPLEITFDGYGDIRISATGSESSMDTFQNDTHKIEVEKHSTFALIFRRTGKYSCRGQGEEHKNKSISAFVFVPNQELFVSYKTSPVSSTDNETILIPCPVSEPNATVSLVKLQGDTVLPVTNKFRYNPRNGFTFSGDNKEDLEGTYFCIASYHTLHKAVEFEVVSGSIDCKRKCGPNSQCEEHNDQQVCRCKSGYEETLVSEKCQMQCKTDADCPELMSCFPQDKNSFLQDILNMNDGRRETGAFNFHEIFHTHGSHVEEAKDKRGECKNPCVYTSKCTFQGTEAEQCQVMDHKPNCFSTGGLSME